MKRVSKRVCGVAVVALLSVVGVSNAVAAAQQPGLWEITVSMDMPGMPMQMPAHTFQQCIKSSDAKDSVPQNPSDKNCKVSDINQSGNTMTWKMSCTGKQAMTGDGKIVYAKDSYTGEAHMQMSGMAMTQKYSGKRLGDCK